MQRRPRAYGRGATEAEAMALRQRSTRSGWSTLSTRRFTAPDPRWSGRRMAYTFSIEFW